MVLKASLECIVCEYSFKVTILAHYGLVYAAAPQHFLCFRPEPQAQRSLGFCFFGLELAPTTPPREVTLVCFLTPASDAATIAALCSCSAAARRTSRNICNSRSLWPNLGSSAGIGCRAFLLHPFWVTNHYGETDLSKGNV